MHARRSRTLPRAVRPLVVAVVLTLAALLTAVLLTPPAASAATSRTAATSGTTSVTVADRSGPRWSALPPAPLPKVDQVAGAWTGHELVVVGEAADDRGNSTAYAVAYDLAQGRWRRLPTPSGDRSIVEGSPKAIWTGREVIVIGGDFSEAYNPATNRWRHLNKPDGVGCCSGFAAVWTGKVLVVYGGGCCAGPENTGGIYDPATNRWQRFTSALLGYRWTSGTWTGREVIIAGGVGFAKGNDGDLVELRTAAAYNPVTRTWRRLPPMPAASSGPMVWDGSRAILFGEKGALAYSPWRNAWTTLRGYDRRSDAQVVRAHGRLLIWGGSVRGRGGEYVDAQTGLAYSRSHGWSRLPAAPVRGRTDSVVAWTGRQLLVLGGTDLRHGAALRL